MAARGTGARRVVVMTDDEELLDEVVRLAPAAEVEPERGAARAGVRRRWHTAGLVLVDEDAARALGPLRLGRRDGVVLVCRGEPPGSVWERAVARGRGARGVTARWRGLAGRRPRRRGPGGRGRP